MPAVAKGAIAESLEVDRVKKNLKGQNMAVTHYKDNLIETIFFLSVCLAIGRNLDLKKPLFLKLLVSESIILCSHNIFLDSLTKLYGTCLFIFAWSSSNTFHDCNTHVATEKIMTTYRRHITGVRK